MPIQLVRGAAEEGPELSDVASVEFTSEDQEREIEADRKSPSDHGADAAGPVEPGHECGRARRCATDGEDGPEEALQLEARPGMLTEHSLADRAGDDQRCRGSDGHADQEGRAEVAVPAGSKTETGDQQRRNSSDLQTGCWPTQAVQGRGDEANERERPQTNRQRTHRGRPEFCRIPTVDERDEAMWDG